MDVLRIEDGTWESVNKGIQTMEQSLSGKAVWVVMARFNHSDVILGVFSSKEAADPFFAQHKDYGDMESTLLDYIVDSPEQR